MSFLTTDNKNTGVRSKEAVTSTKKIYRKPSQQLTVRRKGYVFYLSLSYLLRASFWHINSLLLENINMKVLFESVLKRDYMFRLQLKFNAD